MDSSLKDIPPAPSLQSFWLALAFYGLWMALGLAASAAGLLHMSELQMLSFCVGMATTNLIFYLVIRSGLSGALRDPYMTLLQLLVGLGWGLLLILFAHPGERGLLLAALFTPLLFGMFQLQKTDFLLLGATALAGYAIIAFSGSGHMGEVALATELVRLAVLGAMFLWISLFGIHLRRLRERLSRQNEALKNMLEEISDLAERDDLTRAYNRRFIMEALAEEKQRADRSRMPFSVCIFDLDHFKAVNDHFGHLTGDRVLRAFAERARLELRGLDTLDRREPGRRFARYGGEEFIILLPNTSLAGACHCAERIRTITSEQRFAERCDLTVSAGVAEYRIGESIEDTLRRADGALYLAKQLGRNRVESSDEFSSAWRRTDTSGSYPRPKLPS
jgi:diguanylate cyclase (GGDEF)-like protein